jgi:inactivated superfamily I helicase
MSGFEDFEDSDWRATLAELRLLVVSAGFSDWDSAMAAGLAEKDEERQSPRDDLLEYARSFASFLKVRSAWNLRRVRAELADLVQDREGRPVTEALLIDDEGERHDLLGGEPSDVLVETVTAFASAIAGDGGGYFDGWEREE